MDASARVLNPSEAARRLGVSAKALRLYEQRGLVEPLRTAAGWRAYGPDQMARAAEVAALRRLGLSLAEVARVLAGEPQDLGPALAAHWAALEADMRRLSAALARVGELRAGLARGRTPGGGELARLLVRPRGPVVAFGLPWPWGGERFELCDLKPLTWIIGSKGSGKTRLALRLAEEIPGAAFVPLGLPPAALVPGSALRARVRQAMDWLVGDGAAPSPALESLLAGLLQDGPAALVVDVIEEHGLDGPTQEALGAWLRRRGPEARPLLVITRSSAVLDLAAVGPDEAILLCPANHAPPVMVAPVPGAPGYEAVATCLASPGVRARVTRPEPLSRRTG